MQKSRVSGMRIGQESALGPEGAVIPERMLYQSARRRRLKPNQKDQDSLPSYETLDGILECLTERRYWCMKEIIAMGYEVRRDW